MAVESPSFAVYPRSIDELEDFSLDYQILSGSDFYFPGRPMLRDQSSENPCDQRYGLVRKLNPDQVLHRNNVIARASFDIVDDRWFVVEQPGQGCNSSKLMDAGLEVPEEIDRGFRSELLSHILEIARNLGAEAVIGIAAQNHYEVVEEKIPKWRGLRAFDKVYQSVGFDKLADHNFFKVIDPNKRLDDKDQILKILERDYNYNSMESPTAPYYEGFRPINNSRLILAGN